VVGHCGILMVLTDVGTGKVNDSTDTIAGVVTCRTEIVARYKNIVEISRNDEGNFSWVHRIERADPSPVHAETWSWVDVRVQYCSIVCFMTTICVK
jgi:hypothetical protein